MSVERERAWGRGVTGGLLIAVGVVFLMANFGYWHYGSIGELWPAIFFVIGIGHLIRPTAPRVGSAVFFVMMGLWFFACIHNWYGMTYVNSWPLLLVASGLNMVLSGVLDRALRRDEPVDGGR